MKRVSILVAPLLLWSVSAQADAPSEQQCQQQFAAWTLERQQQFSNRALDKIERRRAERAIDLAREQLEQGEGFCALVAQLATLDDSDPRFNARKGEIHDFSDSDAP
ncbi:hypothetical protein [Aeromonas simiae]|uniref:Uncharacterized protein n=1 Tax=Aeromonas simiae TaxID=218936 RepID=A0A5J6X0M9_9GAMM|nr:hypothetical protein [Aeromonas simiae]QFI55573.1 hypothetical protein FE240_13265 [Aeromonas simiae]